MLPAAFGSNGMDTQKGAQYRKLILERGGELPPTELVHAFLGRKPSPDAFFNEIAGQEK
jgi:Zn-dependent oligopeptidase